MQLSKLNLRLGRIKTVLISHLHGDHYFGLIGLISTMHLFHREHRLKIFSPPGLKEIIDLQLKASETTLNFELEFEVLAHEGCQRILQDDQFHVEAFPLTHGIKCYGFVIRENPKQWRIDKAKMPENILIQEIVKLKQGKDVLHEDGSVKYKLEDYTLPPRPSRAYAYCSDTKYDEGLVPFIQGVDLLYHEATFGDDMKDRAHLTLHSTASEAATIALKAGVGKLLLGHYSTRYKDPTPLLTEGRTVFDETYLSREGDTVSIKE